MATIAKFIDSGLHVLVVGAGYGMSQSARPGAVLGDFFPTERSGKRRMLAIATSSGKIAWSPADLLEIVEIDGKSPGELL